MHFEIIFVFLPQIPLSFYVDRNLANCASISFSDIFDAEPMLSLIADGASDIWKK